MEYVKPKVHDETNYYNGVDLNDKKAVRKEFNKRRATHTFFTLIFIAIFAALGVVAFDYFRVYEMNGKPVFAVKKAVDGGSLYKGIGYEVLYCENGERYLGAVLYQSCIETEEEVSFKNVLYKSLVDYATEKEILDKDNLDSLTINSYTFDEKNEQEGSDYLLDLTVVCKNNKNCFKATKSLKDPNNFKVIMRIDKYTSVYDLVYFKTSGYYYEELVAKYQDKIKQYMIDNGLIETDKLRQFEVRLQKNPGKITYRGVDYDESFLISISYLCTDNNNTCIKAFDKKDDEGDYSNMYYQASVFIGADDEVLLVGPREYLGS